MGKKLLFGLLAAIMVLAGTLVSPADAGGSHDRGRKSREPIVREFNEDGTAASGQEIVGRSQLRRSEHGLQANVRVRGLKPGGVYTFWWVVPQGNLFPDDIFVARGAGVVVGRNGKARVRIRAHTGQEGIAGFPVLEGASFASLNDPEGATVRVEIAYHGQAADAGDDLDQWLSDFWTGAECPPETPNPNPNQPHCPVWFAATHQP
ncbi:MAG: hypothetical protein ACR2QO_05835 [Acidimicrobiales bacterium]